MFSAGAVWGGSSPLQLHLHGMDWFRNAEPDDLVIASKFRRQHRQGGVQLSAFVRLLVTSNKKETTGI